LRAAFLALVLAAAATPPKAAFRVRVLSLIQPEDVDRWLKAGFFGRLSIAHRGTVRAGQKTFLPIVAENVPRGASLIADFQVMASDGRVVLRRPACCRASKESAPGVYVLHPSPDLLLLPSDLEGLYTAQAVVWDESGAERRATERLVLMQ
jgi:hypothetical protein